MSRWQAIEEWLTYLVVTIEHTANRGETSQTKSSAVIEETPPSSILILSKESIKVTTSSSTTAHYCCFLCCDWCVCIECPPKLSFLRRCKLLLCDWKIEWQYYIYRRFESQYYIYIIRWKRSTRRDPPSSPYYHGGQPRGPDVIVSPVRASRIVLTDACSDFHGTFVIPPLSLVNRPNAERAVGLFGYLVMTSIIFRATEVRNMEAAIRAMWCSILLKIISILSPFEKVGELTPDFSQ